MPKYDVHIYREMRLYYPDIEAPSPQDAARLALKKPSADAQKIEDCNGATFAALVDIDGDPEFDLSQVTDFEEDSQPAEQPDPSGSKKPRKP